MIASRTRALVSFALLGVLAAGGRASIGAAQDPDTVAADTTARDTTDFSELFLKSQEEGRLRAATLPLLNRPAILPALSRRIMPRDTIEWSNAETVGDLLTKIPGVHLWRGGWVGRPEMPGFQARAAASVEYRLDGVPYIALGPDSVSVDPSLLPLSFLDRIEVERLPGRLVVHLYTRRHDRLPPRTRVAVASGDLDIARYEGMLEKRGQRGFGFVAAAQHLAVPLGSADQGSFSSTQAWLQASYVPSPRFAASMQLFRGGVEREDIVGPAPARDTLSGGLDGRRTDFHASLTFASDSGDLGSRASLLLGYSSWVEDSTALSLPGPIPPHQHVRSIDQSITQIGALVGHRTRTTSLEGAAWYRSRWTPLEVRAEAAASPADGVALTATATYQRHDGGRSSRWLTLRGGLPLPLGARATGLARIGSLVETPMIEADRAVDLADWAALVALDRPRVAFEAGYWRTAATTPEGFPLYRHLPDRGPVEPARWLTFSGRLAPRQWLILDGWFSDALGAGPEGQPPTHSILSATIQSKFLRTFRSGIFTLQLRASMETWGTHTLARDAAGEPVQLPGATFFRGLIQFRIGGFTAYYDRVNLQASDLGYVPGLGIPRIASSFGVRWEFSN